MMAQTPAQMFWQAVVIHVLSATCWGCTENEGAEHWVVTGLAEKWAEELCQE